MWWLAIVATVVFLLGRWCLITFRNGFRSETICESIVKSYFDGKATGTDTITICKAVEAFYGLNDRDYFGLGDGFFEICRDREAFLKEMRQVRRLSVEPNLDVPNDDAALLYGTAMGICYKLQIFPKPPMGRMELELKTWREFPYGYEKGKRFWTDPKRQSELLIVMIRIEHYLSKMRRRDMSKESSELH